MRRPCSKYTRHRSSRGEIGAGRKDRIMFSHTLKSCFIAKGDKVILRSLIKDGMIINRQCCPKCGHRRTGRATELQPSTKCTRRGCRYRFMCWKDHPILNFHGNALSWSDQSALLTMVLQDVPNHLMHSLGGWSHFIIEQWKSKFRSHICSYVEKEQDNIQMGIPGQWADIEADEVTLGKRASSPGGKVVRWIQYLGLMRRGSPETLVLIQLPARSTTSKAPGPGPLVKKVWAPIAAKYLQGQQVVLHTDSAKSLSIAHRWSTPSPVWYTKKRR